MTCDACNYKNPVPDNAPDEVFFQPFDVDGETKKLCLNCIAYLEGKGVSMKTYETLKELHREDTNE